LDATNASADVSINQQFGGGTWHSLGTITFEPGRREEVSLSGEADGVVVADAVAWVGPHDIHGSADVAVPGSAMPLQSAVNGGYQPWRLDPLAVAHAEATALGLATSDPMHLLDCARGPPWCACSTPRVATTFS
jgi:hypothetical protein